MNSTPRSEPAGPPAAARRPVLAGLLLALGLTAALSACENHGKPFVPITPHGPDSTLVDGLEEGRWTAKKSPYYAMSPIRVLAGRRLIIDPGVSVVFTKPEYGMLIEGTLLAVGKPDSFITFRPTFRSNTNPLPGQWGEIAFRNSAGSRIEFARLRYGKRGVRLDGSTLELRGCYLSNNLLDGVQATRSNLTMTDCEMGSNGRHGIFLDGCEAPLYSVRLEHLNIGYNQGAGIWAASSSYLLRRSDIKNNGQEGTPLLNAGSSGLHFEGLAGLTPPTLRQCNLDANRPCDLRNIMGSGLMVQADSNYWGPTTTEELVIRSGGRKDRCNFNLRAVCDGLDSLSTDVTTVNVCHWSDLFIPNFSGSGQAPAWHRLTPRAR